MVAAWPRSLAVVLRARPAGGYGVVIDSGGPSAAILEAIERHDVTVEHLLLTHHHVDHVEENHVYKERFGVEILAHPLEAERLLDVDTTIDPDGWSLEVGGLSIDAIHTPGHTDVSPLARGGPRVRRRLHGLGRGGHAGAVGPRLRWGHKAWVRWKSSGADDIVPASQVERAGEGEAG